MSSEACGIWMLSEGSISGYWSLQGAEDQERKCQSLLNQEMGRELQFLGPVDSARANDQWQSLAVPHKCLSELTDRVQRQSSSHVGTVRKCLPAAPPAVPKDWKPGAGTVQGDSQVSQMHVFAVAHHGFGSSTYSARGLCSGMRLRLAAEGPAGRTRYLLRDVYFYHCFLLSKQANVTQSFLSSLPTFTVGCLAKTTSQECCKNRPLLPTIPCDPLSLQCPLVSGSKVTLGDFAAVLSQLPGGLSTQGCPVVEKRGRQHAGAQ